MGLSINKCTFVDKYIEMMKAIFREHYGSPSVLEVRDVEKPTVKDNEVLVQVHATTVNRTDCSILTGKPFLTRLVTGLFKPKMKITGTDFAGQVVEIGDKVSQFKLGDRVWGFNDNGMGSHAEYLCIAENGFITTIPEGFSYQEAVCCAEGAHYAYNFINKVRINEGDKVLVNGATGAIGSALLQMLKSMGVYVTAVGDTKNLALLTSLGADRVMDYTQEDFTKDTERYQYVFDAVGKSSFGPCKHLLLAKRAYISSELGPNAENLYLPILTKITGGKRVVFPFPESFKKSIPFIQDLMEKGAFQALIDRSYPMEDVCDAYVYVAKGLKTGNVVLDIRI